MNKILIYGKGKTGNSLKKLAKKHNIDYEIYDDSDFNPEINISKFDKIVVSPGIPYYHQIYNIAEKNNIEIIGEIEFAYQFYNGKIISITGTDGKSTTTKIIYEILKTKYKKTYIGGNYGIPFSEIVAEKNPEIVVLELSSFQTYSIKDFKPNIGILLNFAQDHLNWHRTMKHYLNSKYKMFKNQTENDIAILNFDDGNAKNSPTKSKKYFFSLNKLPEDIKGIYLKNRDIVLKIDKEIPVTNVDHLPLKGEHNIQNVMVGILVGFLNDVPMGNILNTIKSFKGLPYRFEYKGKIKGIHFYNDSKATTVQAVEKAVKSSGENSIVLIGGINKGGDFSRLVPILKENAKKVIIYGESKEEISEMLQNVEIEKAENLKEAFKKAVKIAKEDDKVVLSPGCASFDQFKNYEDRGEFFNQLIKDFERE